MEPGCTCLFIKRIKKTAWQKLLFGTTANAVADQSHPLGAGALILSDRHTRALISLLPAPQGCDFSTLKARNPAPELKPKSHVGRGKLFHSPQHPLADAFSQSKPFCYSSPPPSAQAVCPNAAARGVSVLLTALPGLQFSFPARD